MTCHSCKTSFAAHELYPYAAVDGLCLRCLGRERDEYRRQVERLKAELEPDEGQERRLVEE